MVDQAPRQRHDLDKTSLAKKNLRAPVAAAAAAASPQQAVPVAAPAPVRSQPPFRLTIPFHTSHPRRRPRQTLSLLHIVQRRPPSYLHYSLVFLDILRRSQGVCATERKLNPSASTRPHCTILTRPPTSDLQHQSTRAQLSVTSLSPRPKNLSSPSLRIHDVRKTLIGTAKPHSLRPILLSAACRVPAKIHEFWTTTGLAPNSIPIVPTVPTP